ncbi:MAG: EamA family transporter [bacterium]
MWIVFAFLSAIFAKLGLKDLDPTLATTIRSIIMALFLVVVSFFLGKFKQFSFSSMSSKEWILIALAGFSGALSWLAYFVALQKGNASEVVAIDRLSVIFVAILAALFLGEAFTWKIGFGAVFISLGAILISLK